MLILGIGLLSRPKNSAVLHKVIFFCVFCVMANNLCAQELSQEEKLKALDEKIERIMRERQIPSVSFAVLQEGKTPHLRALGLANKELRESASLTTPYRIASISKMVVAIAVMQLVEAGELSLDDKVSQLLPRLAFSNKWAETHPLRLEHLLESTTGWDDISLKEFAYNNNPPLGLATAMTINPSNRSSRWPPGTRHAYANSAAAVAALVVESKTGMSFYSYAEQKIFKPLGMQSATYALEVENIATAYKQGKPVNYKPILFRPAGGLSVDIEDMAKLTKFYLDKGQGLLRPETIEQMERDNTTNVSPFSAGYGQFNHARFYDGVHYRGHGGSLPGWLSELSYSPKHKTGFVVLQNSENGRGFREVVKAITDYLAEGYAVPQYKSVDIPSDWQNMSGYYRYQNPRFSKRYAIERLFAVDKLEVKGDKAVLTQTFLSEWRRELTYQGENTWQNDKGEAVMRLGEDPILGQVIHYGDLVFEPTSAFGAWIDKVILIYWLIMVLLMLGHSGVWPIQFIRGKCRESGSLTLRLSLSAATWSVVLFLIFFALGMSAPIERLGSIGLVSSGVFITSIMIPLTTVWASCMLFLNRKIQSWTLLYRFSIAYIATQWIVIAYLAYFGVIGILSWA